MRRRAIRLGAVWLLASLLPQGLAPALPVSAQPQAPRAPVVAPGAAGSAARPDRYQNPAPALPETSSFWADADGDQDVDADDLRVAAGVWNCLNGQPCYPAGLDRDGDGDIDALDLAALGNEYDVSPPVIVVASPADGAVVGGTSLLVSGTLSDAHAVTAVTVGSVAANITGGEFEATLSLADGSQALHVQAVDEIGQAASVSQLLFADQAGPSLTVEAPADRQSVYSLRPAITIAYTDFYAGLSLGSLQVTLSQAGGPATDITGDLAVGPTAASGVPGFDLAQDATYTLMATLQDSLGNTGTAMTTFYVPLDPASLTPPQAAVDSGWVSGVVYASDTCDAYLVSCQGLPGARVTLGALDEDALLAARQAPTSTSPLSITLPVTGTVITGPDGFFAFPVGDTDNYVLMVEKPGYTYGQRVAEVVRGHSAPANAVYLTPLDPAVTLCDQSGCAHTSADGQMRLTIPAGAIAPGDVLTVTATELDRVMFLPTGELPPQTEETYAFDLGGEFHYDFLQPVTVEVRNTRAFAPGVAIPLGFWNAELLQWEPAGLGVIDPTGEWAQMQVMHFSVPDLNAAALRQMQITVDDQTRADSEACAREDCASEVALRSGHLRQAVALPAVDVLGQPMAPAFRYSSSRAAPSELIEVDLGLDRIDDVQLGSYLQVELFIEGEKTANFTYPLSAAGSGEMGVFRYLWDGQDSQGRRLPPGVYRYAVHVQVPYRAQYYLASGGVFGRLPDLTQPLGIFTDVTADRWHFGSVTLGGDRPGLPFGHGWALAGQQFLYEDDAGRVLIDDGQDGLSEFYFPGRNLLPVTGTQVLAADSDLAGMLVPGARALPDTTSGAPEASAGQPSGVTAPLKPDLAPALPAPLVRPPERAAASPPAGPVGPGYIVTDTTWTLAGSPYTITNFIQVVAGVTLTIEPGVVVKGNNNAELEIQGHLVALGTPSQPITFTSAADTGPMQWAGLRFTGGTGQLEHVTVRYAGQFILGSLRVTNVTTGEVRLENSQVVDGANTGAIDYGVYIQDSRVTVSNTLIARNGNNLSDFALYSSGAGSVITVTGNSFVDNAGLAMQVGAQNVHRVTNNTFSGNGSNRILLTVGTFAPTASLAVQPGLEAYELQSEPIVPAGGTLTVAPGVTIMGRSNSSLRINGHLAAIGTPTQPITFTSSADSGPTQWAGLFFNGGTGHLNYATVRYAGQFYFANLRLFNVAGGQVRIENSRILNGANAGTTDYGVYIENSRVTISNTLISGNNSNLSDYALYSTGAGSVVTVTNSTFQQNAGQLLRLPAASLPAFVDNEFMNNASEQADLFGNLTLAADLTLPSQPGLTRFDFLGDLTVPAGQTLTVGPGTTVKFFSAFDLLVNGALEALGTASDPIVFTSHTDTQPGQWPGLRVEGGHARFAYATIRYAVTGLQVTDGGAELVGATIVENFNYGIHLLGALGVFSLAASEISENGDNGGQGLRNQTGTLVDARYNVWGDPSGPYHPALNPGGLGNPVSDDVIFDPWLADGTGEMIFNLNPADHTVLTFDSASGTYTRRYPDGTLVQFDSAGRHDFTRDPDGNTTAYTYNPDGTPASQAVTLAGEGAPRWTWTFDYSAPPANGAATITVTDPAGRVSVLDIDRHGHLSSLAQPGLAAPMRFAYDPAARMTQKIDERGFATSYVYDAWGRIDRVELPPRPIFDPATGLVASQQEIRDYAPADTSFQLANTLAPGTPLTPTAALPLAADLLSTVAVGSSTYQGRTNQWGYWQVLTDGIGRTTIYDRDASNNLTRLVEADGDCTVFTYNPLGQMLGEARFAAAGCAAQTSPQARTYTYEPMFGQLKTTTDPLGRTTTYVYDYELSQGSAGRLVQVLWPAVDNGGGVVVTPTMSHGYNAWGQLTTLTDTLGAVTRYVYTQGTPDEASGGGNPRFLPGVTPVPGHLTQVVEDAAGEALTTTWTDFDAAGNPGRFVGPDGAETTLYLYDAQNRLTQRTDALGMVTAFAYDDGGNLVRRVADYTADGTTGRNIASDYTYDPHGQMLSLQTSDGALIVRRRLDYDLQRLLARQDAGLGNSTRYAYDDARQLVRVIDAAGQITSASYTPDGRLERLTDPDGFVTRYQYDGLNRLTAVVQDDGGLGLTQSYAYDLANTLTAATDPAGATTCYAYDALYRLTQATFDCGGLNLVQQFAYDLNDNLLRVTDERGVVTAYQYDALNRLTRVRLDDGGLNLDTLYAYDAAGNLEQTTDQRGVVSAYAYDALNRLSQACDDALGLNLCTGYGYDRLGFASRATDPNGVSSLTTYNAFGLPVQVVDDAGGLAAATRFAYDGTLNLARLTDANGNTTTYAYTPRNELALETFADGSAEAYAYDGRGNLATRVDRAGNTLTTTYDGAGRAVQVSLADGGQQTFSYDGAGRALSAGQTMNGHTSLVTFAYNPLGDPTSSTQRLDGGPVFTTGYAYDYAAGERTVSYPSGAQRVETLDPLGRLDTVGDGASLIADYAYDDVNGFYAVANANGVTDRFDFDTLGRPSRVRTTGPGGALFDLGYGYNPAGNPVYRQRLHAPGAPADVFQYDNLYRLREAHYDANSTNPAAITAFAAHQAYGLDLLGNRLALIEGGATQAYGPNDGQHLTDPLNRYQQVDGAALSYDLRGNLLSDGAHTYSYDLLNRLIGASTPGAAAAADYVYDALGRRIAAVVDGQVTHFVYGAGLEVLEERAADSTLLARYTYGAGLDEPLLMERGGTAYIYHRDSQGSVTGLTSAAGTLVEQYRYDAYGAPAFFDGGGGALPAPALGNPYLFTGRRYDLETGNYDYRARAYSPALGRFMQNDPLGYATGELNLYQYVRDNPLRFVDPLGLDEGDPSFVENFIKQFTKKTLQKIATGSGTKSLAGKIGSKTAGTAGGIGLQLLSPEGVEAARGITQIYGGQKADQGRVNERRHVGDIRTYSEVRDPNLKIPEPPQGTRRYGAPPQPQPVEPEPDPCEEAPAPRFEDLSRVEQIAVLEAALRAAEELTKRRYVDGAGESEVDEALKLQDEISKRLQKLLAEELREAELQLFRATKQGATGDAVRQATERRDQLRQRVKEVDKIRKFFEAPRR